MSKVTYEIVEHDGGWAYRVDGTFSETFASQRVAGEEAGISYEDAKGRWHDELASGQDRPETDVEG